MKPFVLLVLSFSCLNSMAVEPSAIREAAKQIVRYPASMKVENIRTAFGARGDGRHDDTAALQQAINRRAAFVYLPNGTYLIRDRLIYDQGASVGPTIVGESRDGVVIKLADDARGFGDPKAPRALLRLVPDKKVSADFFKIRLRNVTLDAGRHRGAIGLQFYANNNGQCRNVRIVGRGVAGLDLSHMLNGPLLVSHVSIEGFDSGVLAGSGPYNSQTLEYVHLKGQTDYGIRNEGECLSIRGLVSDNECPALLAGGNTVLIDSQLRGGSRGRPAIISGGSLFARNVEIGTGYSLAVQGHEYHWKRGLGEATDVRVSGAHIDEWCHRGGRSQWRTDDIRSLNLPVEDPPVVPPPADFSQWVCIDDFGADGTDKLDDTAALNAALRHARENGKSVICFAAGGRYRLNGDFEIGDSITHVLGAGSFLFHGRDERIRFRVVDSDAPVVTFDQFCKALSPNYRIQIENASTRTLVVDCVRGELLASGPGKTFLSDSCHHLRITHPQARVWARQLNSESRAAVANENHGGKLWVLGMKSEKTACLIGTYKGGQTEVLGTWAYVIGRSAPANPLWLVDESAASFAGIIQWHHGRKFYRVLVRETQNGEQRDFTMSKNDGAAALPLYRSR